jgi:hypothetical protein
LDEKKNIHLRLGKQYSCPQTTHMEFESPKDDVTFEINSLATYNCKIIIIKIIVTD